MLRDGMASKVSRSGYTVIRSTNSVRYGHRQGSFHPQQLNDERGSLECAAEERDVNKPRSDELGGHAVARATLSAERIVGTVEALIRDSGSTD
ncbi:MAG: hypothetical protein GDA49_11350 [Rhodospirillales bacterium]|nr:hypothetical protein [Rhodospirillales bacterium]